MEYSGNNCASFHMVLSQFTVVQTLQTWRKAVLHPIQTTLFSKAGETAVRSIDLPVFLKNLVAIAGFSRTPAIVSPDIFLSFLCGRLLLTIAKFCKCGLLIAIVHPRPCHPSPVIPSPIQRMHGMPMSLGYPERYSHIYNRASPTVLPSEELLLPTNQISSFLFLG